MSTELALYGGSPVWVKAWPRWPEVDARTDSRVLGALRQARWAISAPSVGSRSLERSFAERFASYSRAPYCVATDHGSSALVLALEALDVGPGDTVLVPVLTWVATATAVLRVGAVPIFVDVDPSSGCMSADAAAAALEPTTRAALIVHLHCVMADMRAFERLRSRTGVGLIEDCAQACGSMYSGRHAGTIGDLGAFSMQHGKALACGEGGAVLTQDPALYFRLQQLRADSRVYVDEPVAAGEMELELVGSVMGTNRCMSELHAAVLLDQIDRLDHQIERKEQNAAALGTLLEAVPGTSLIERPLEMDRQSFYECAIRIDRSLYADRPLETVAQAVSAELGLPVYLTDRPLNRNRHYSPQSLRRFSFAPPLLGEFAGADAFYDSTLVFHHSALLGTDAEITALAEGFAKVQRYAHELKATVC